jgi:Flp pilus assembly protein TadG
MSPTSANVSRKNARSPRCRRRGNIVVLGGALMTGLLVMVAFAVDVGYIVHVKTELQRTADACAMAGVMYLPSEAAASTAAQEVAAQNPSGSEIIVSASDVEFGHWDRDTASFVVGTPVNAIRVTARRTEATGNPVTLFFAKIMGQTTTDVTANAIAMFDNELCGPLIGIDSVSVPGTPETDSYDASAGAYDPASGGDEAGLCSDGPITISGNAVVNGSARSGMGYDVTMNGGAIVTGSTGSRLRSLELPLVDASAAAASNNNLNAPLIPRGNSQYSPIDNQGNFSLGANETYTLPPGTYYFNDFSLSGQAELTIVGNTVIYLTGDLTRTGGVTVNNNTQVPSNLQFQMTGGTANINSTNDFYGTIYAPNTDVSLSGSADLFGVIVGKTLNVGGTGEVHYDESLMVDGIDFPRRTGMVN